FFLNQIAKSVVTKSGAPFDGIADVFTPDSFSETLCHHGIAVYHEEIDQTRAAPNSRLYHSRKGTGQCVFHRSKSHSFDRIRLRAGTFRWNGGDFFGWGLA